MLEPGRPPRRSRRPVRRLAFGLTATGVLFGGCSSTADTPKASAPAPTTQDALRIAQASQDPMLNVSPPTFTYGPVDQHAYLCAPPEPCEPREGRVSRVVATEAVSRADLAKYFVNNLSIRGWQVESVFCDPDKNQYVVLAAKTPDIAKSYPGRFELLAFDKAEARITVPAFGAENSFNLKPDHAAYPSGTCPSALTNALETARAGDGRPMTPGSAVPTSKP